MRLLLQAIFIYASLSRLPRLVSSCRNQPEDSGFPSSAQWEKLDEQLQGRLISVVPYAEVCRELGCTPLQWQSGQFATNIPGSMLYYNWEQDYTSVPSSLCLYNGTTCGQGRVPLYAINASSAVDIQVGVKFASEYNLRVAIKSSGHDFSGRSTQKNSLLFWTRHLKNISFTDSFIINGKDFGSAVTVGSGVGLHELYNASKLQGKMVVGGTAVMIAAGGGYVQGGGHSAFSPLFGLAADNTLELQVVISNGTFVTANEYSHSDLFWAMRGGGSGSWGVIISATFRTYPTFNVTSHSASVIMTSTAQTGAVMAAHAAHIFDIDGAGQYFDLSNAPPAPNITMTLYTVFPHLSDREARAKMAPFLDAAQDLGASVVNETTETGLANGVIEHVGPSDDESGVNLICGSRFVSATAYRTNQALIGETYTALLDQGVSGILGNLVAGGKVSENANVDSAVHPKWRTAKALVIVARMWDETATPAQIKRLQEAITNEDVPLLNVMTGEENSGSYSNEGDVREPDFQETFFGPNYRRLEESKAEYDPKDLFIVGAGVGSERWDAEGLCRV